MSARTRVLWFATELYSPNEAATGYILTRLAEALAARGTVRVLCVKPQPEPGAAASRACETINDVHVIRVAQAPFDRQSLAGRAANSVIVALRMFVRGLVEFRKGDIVLVVTNPPVLPFFMAVAARFRSLTILLLVHDMYPEAAVLGGAIRANGFLARIGYRLRDALLRNADRVIVLGRDMQRFVAVHSPEAATRTRIIPSWADSDTIGPELPEESELLRTLGLRHHFVLGYAGTIGRVQDIEMLMRAAEVLRTKAPDVHFLFAGSGAKSDLVRAGAARLGNITLLGSKPRSEQADFLNACHVSIMALVQGMAGIGVPSRLYNALAAGKPVVAAVDRGPNQPLSWTRRAWEFTQHLDVKASSSRQF